MSRASVRLSSFIREGAGPGECEVSRAGPGLPLVAGEKSLVRPQAVPDQVAEQGYLAELGKPFQGGMPDPAAILLGAGIGASQLQGRVSGEREPAYKQAGKDREAGVVQLDEVEMGHDFSEGDGIGVGCC